HIAEVLEIIDLIYIPGVNSHQLRMKIFPLSLADDAKQCRINEGEGKITVWEELVKKLFCKFYPESYDGEEEMLDEGDNWGTDPLEFILQVNSSFNKHMKMEGRTKKVLFHAWMNGSWNKKNGILDPYQKLKGFYKGVLNLGPDYIRDARTEEWLTRGHISVHEME
ncbi:hypothetical protein Tco_1322691, partial [Tanacetum coccineum]